MPVRQTWGVGSTCASPKQPLLEVCDLTVTYAPEHGSQVRAVEAASFEVGTSEVVAILGESGSGKSTLASAIVRLLPSFANYDRGAIRFQGQDLLQMTESELREIRGARISHIPQDPAQTLNPVMRVGTQISEVLRAHRDLSRASRNARVQELLAEVGFENPEEIASAYPHQLSGGQRQRIAIAQAISCGPGLVVADEPTSKLDASLRSGIIELLARLRQKHGTAFILISHDPGIVSGFADRVLVMYAGRVIEQGPVAEVWRQPLHPYTQGLLKLAQAQLVSSNRARTLFPSIAGEPADLSCMTVACRFEPRCSERMKICTKEFPPELTPHPSHRVSCFKYGE